VAISCEHGSKTSVRLVGGEFLVQTSDYQLFKESCALRYKSGRDITQLNVTAEWLTI